MNTQYIIGLLICNDFYKAIRIAIDERFSDGHERKLTDFHVKSLFLCLLFCEPDACSLWACIDAPGNLRIIYRFIFQTCNMFNGCYPFVRSDMCQLETAYHVADCINM